MPMRADAIVRLHRSLVAIERYERSNDADAFGRPLSIDFRCVPTWGMRSGIVAVAGSSRRPARGPASVGVHVFFRNPRVETPMPAGARHLSIPSVGMTMLSRCRDISRLDRLAFGHC